MEIYCLIQLTIYRVRAPDKAKQATGDDKSRITEMKAFPSANDKLNYTARKHKKSISILSKWSPNKELNAHKWDTGFM